MSHGQLNQGSYSCVHAAKLDGIQVVTRCVVRIIDIHCSHKDGFVVVDLSHHLHCLVLLPRVATCWMQQTVVTARRLRCFQRSVTDCYLCDYLVNDDALVAGNSVRFCKLEQSMTSECFYVSNKSTRIETAHMLKATVYHYIYSYIEMEMYTRKEFVRIKSHKNSFARKFSSAQNSIYAFHRIGANIV